MPAIRKAILDLTRDQVEDFLGKHDNHAACQCEKSVCPLTWVVAFEGQTDLHNTEAQED